MLYGIMTGFDWFTFREDIENGTAGLIDWTLTGAEGEPWPPDVWIEGNNGRDAMRVNYKGERRSFDYEEFRVNDRQADGAALARRVLDHLADCMADDVRAAVTEARTPEGGAST